MLVDRKSREEVDGSVLITSMTLFSHLGSIFPPNCNTPFHCCVFVMIIIMCLIKMNGIM